MSTRFVRLTCGVLAVAVGVLASVVPADADPVDRQLAQVRRATARYHRVSRAVDDGYQLGYRGMVTGCIEHPTDGAMGYHYFDADLFEDPDVDPLRPEGLVYAPGRNGKLELVAVEWVVPGDVWEATGATVPPSVLGFDLHVLNPALGWYIHHAWIWKHNPAGIFEDWNPAVDCSVDDERDRGDRHDDHGGDQGHDDHGGDDD